MEDFKSLLDQANYDLQDRVAAFMATGRQISELRLRIGLFRNTGSASVNAKAEGLYATASGLLGTFNSIEGDAASAAASAQNLRAQMASDPLWQQMLNNPFLALGWAGQTQIDQRVGAAKNLLGQVSSLLGRINSYMDAVARLKSDEADLENQAEGKGVKAALETLGGAATSYMSMLKYLALAAGAFFVWDLAKPFATARAMHRNPRRRRSFAGAR